MSLRLGSGLVKTTSHRSNNVLRAPLRSGFDLAVGWLGLFFTGFLLDRTSSDVLVSCTVNPRYCGHSRDRELVSSIERVRNNGRLFQSNVYKNFLMGILQLSVLAGCP